MPVNLTDIGIQSLDEGDATLVESYSVEKKLDTSVIMTNTGGFGAGQAFDPVFEFSYSGRGDLPSGVAVGGLTPPDMLGISGGVTIVEKVKLGEKNDEFNSWETSGKNFPGAS